MVDKEEQSELRTRADSTGTTGPISRSLIYPARTSTGSSFARLSIGPEPPLTSVHSACSNKHGLDATTDFNLRFSTILVRCKHDWRRNNSLLASPNLRVAYSKRRIVRPVTMAVTSGLSVELAALNRNPSATDWLRAENGLFSTSGGEYSTTFETYNAAQRRPISNLSPNCAYFHPRCSIQISVWMNCAARSNTSSFSC